MRLRLGLATAVWLLAAGCQASVPPTPAPSSAPSPLSLVAVTPPAPSPRASPAAPVPPPAGSSRVALVNTANAAYRSGDLALAVGLYERAVNTPPGADEGQATAALTDLARFRAMLGLLATSREEEARSQLDGLQQRDPASPFARLAAQVWDQYTMTALLRGACAQVQPQLAAQLGPTLTALQAVGVSGDAQSLCSLPQG